MNDVRYLNARRLVDAAAVQNIAADRRPLLLCSAPSAGVLWNQQSGTALYAAIVALFRRSLSRMSAYRTLF